MDETIPITLDLNDGGTLEVDLKIEADIPDYSCGYLGYRAFEIELPKYLIDQAEKKGHEYLDNQLKRKVNNAINQFRLP